MTWEPTANFLRRRRPGITLRVSEKNEQFPVLLLKIDVVRELLYSEDTEL